MMLIVRSLQDRVAELLSANKKLSVWDEKLQAENEQERTETGILTKRLKKINQSIYQQKL